MENTLKHKMVDLVKQPADFSHYKDGNLYYEIIIDDCRYEFPVDITDKEDIGNAKFESSYSKSLTLKRYIDKAIKSEEFRVEKFL